MREPTRRFWGLQYAISLIFSLAACSSAPTAQDSAPAPRATAEVVPGIEVLLAGDMASLAGKRVGLITNHTGKLRDGRTTIDALYNDPRIKLVALFAPEHGIRGAALAGEHIDNTVDQKTGLPVNSLYGTTRKPTPEMLANIDALVFDIQDVGARFYTYPWTMTLAMQAAAENNKRFVVLDRPNAVNGALVQGNVNDTLSFVGQWPVPMRHGLTVGELARMINAEYKIGADLVVIPVTGLTRAMWFDDTGLPWTAPSPNMRTLEAATHYSGLCLFEGTNISTGRGTDRGYEQIGAPWLKPDELIARLNSYGFEGVRFEAVEFTPVNPADQKFNGIKVKGVRFVATDRDAYDPPRVAIAALIEAKRLHPEFAWGPSMTRLAGNTRIQELIDAGATLDQVTADWQRQIDAFKKLRAPYLLYR